MKKSGITLFSIMKLSKLNVHALHCIANCIIFMAYTLIDRGPEPAHKNSDSCQIYNLGVVC